MPQTVAIIGGGLVGLATARALGQLKQDLKIVVLEKETLVAQHQSGHNSGVIHSGIYYKPGSVKAITCRAGQAMLTEFCYEKGVRFERCGKVIVATVAHEIAALNTLESRGRENGVACRRVTLDELREIEPHVAGIEGLHVPETGIVDYPGMAQALADDLIVAGNAMQTNSKVLKIEHRSDEVVLETTAGEVTADFAVNCAGLHSDKIAVMAGVKPDLQIVPFRGEYFVLSSEAAPLCKHLIYPVPDPAFPFLGVHFTRMIGGGVECGPNAVLAFAREGYSKGKLNPSELAGTLAFRGFQRLARRFWKIGFYEMRRSFSRKQFLRDLQMLIPELKSEDLRGTGSGVRAQAVRSDGSLVDDFYFEEQSKMLHVLNAPSPGATACLAIGQQIAARVSARMSLNSI